MKRGTLQVELQPETMESLETYAVLLGKDINRIVEEALIRYFAEAEQRLAHDEERNLTTFSYDEFWDGLDIG
jgi:hypothetical protein